jgi:phospholipid/cholesterol/gamma-HCH transport system substrate-binding protein
VATIQLGDDGWVRVGIALDPAVRLPADPVVVLGTAGLVGEWQATITPRQGAPNDRDVRQQLTEASGERGVLPGATMAANVGHLTSGAGRVIDDVGVLAANARIAFDDSAARDLRATVASARVLLASLAAAGVAVRRSALRIDSTSDRGELGSALRDVAAIAADVRAVTAELRRVTVGGDETRTSLDRVVARVDTLVAMTTAGTGTMGRVMTDPGLYANADSLIRELRGLVADVKANPKRYVTIRVF